MRGKKPATGVWVRCATCGRQRLPVNEVTLRCCDDVDDVVAWRCTRCGRPTTTPVRDRRDLERLVAAGVRRVSWTSPRELEEHAALPPLTVDEVLGWVALLERGDWLESEVRKLGG